MRLSPGPSRAGTASSGDIPLPVPYFEPTYEEFRTRTIWSLSNAFTSAFKGLDPTPQFKGTAKLGEFPGDSILTIVLDCRAVSAGRPLVDLSPVAYSLTEAVGDSDIPQ
jgi:hypothetical protein